MSVLTKLGAGAGAVTAFGSLCTLAIQTIPALKSVKSLHEAFDAFSHVYRPILAALNIDTAFGVIVFNIVLLWSAVFVAIHAFIASHEGTSVWRHIQINSCGLKRQTAGILLLCTLPKFVVAFLTGPLVCVMAIYSSIVSGTRLLSMSYLTVDPKIVTHYMAIGAFIVVAALAILGFTSSH
jgi:hypothetical protein